MKLSHAAVFLALAVNPAVANGPDHQEQNALSEIFDSMVQKRRRRELRSGKGGGKDDILLLSSDYCNIFEILEGDFDQVDLGGAILSKKGSGVCVGDRCTGGVIGTVSGDKDSAGCQSIEIAINALDGCASYTFVCPTLKDTATLTFQDCVGPCADDTDSADPASAFNVNTSGSVIELYPTSPFPDDESGTYTFDFKCCDSLPV